MKEQRIYLRAFEPDDVVVINRWRNDDDIFRQTSGNKYYISSIYDKKWIEDKIFNNEKNIYLCICLKENNTLIGYLSINDIDYRNRTAKWGGIVIGDKSNWSKGFATEAATLMIKFVFDELGMNCLHALWLESHTNSIKMGKKVGFVEEGILRDRVYKLGKYHNQLSMSLTRKEFESIYNNRDLSHSNKL